MDNNFFLNYGIQPQIHFDLSSNCFFNPDLNNSMDQFSQFDSALSSIVSSPVSATNSVVSNESFQNQQLVGKLGICNSGEIYPISNQFVKTNVPISGNSIPNYPPVQCDPGFAERAAKFSCFGSRSFNGRTEQLRQNNNSEVWGYKSSPLMGNNVKMTRVLSSPSLNLCRSQMGTQENTNSMQNQIEIEQILRSPVSTQIPDSNSKKRKALSKGKSKETKVKEENEVSKSKRLKESENGIKTEEQKQGNDSDNEEEKVKTKAPEPPKDYIHVRARRGEATDSHSLAERVRREKISERMTFLQDLVPGCNKVTGKALMLDEIINYVESLQRQVEFLSMKLATVNSRLDFNLHSLISNDVMQPNGSMGNQKETGASFLGQLNQKLTQLSNNNMSNVGDPLHSIFHHNIGLQSSQLEQFAQDLTQFQTLCEGDLQSIVQMGLFSEGLPGSNWTSHMKMEQ